MKSIIAVVPFIIVLTACTTVPDRFVRDQSLPESCGYKTESLSEKSFSLEVFHKSYSFLPAPDSAIQEGRECYLSAARMVAKKAGKSISPVATSDMSASATRNILDGNYSVYVTGKITYLGE